MDLQLFSLVLLVVLFGPVCSEDQLGSRLGHLPYSEWNETAQQKMVVADSDGQSEPVTLDVENTPGQHRRHRRTILASDQRPLDYEFFRGVGYYKFHTKPQTWEQARRICESEGAHLMIVNSVLETRIMRGFLARNLPTPGVTWTNVFHMGFSDHDNEGLFVTVLGEPLTTSGFNSWQRNEPNNDARRNIDTDADCGCINAEMLLDDCYCSVILPYWCEMSL